MKAGETLLVLGAAGGVGLAAIEIGKALGARVIACASTDEKLAVCREHGADATIDYATEDMRDRIKTLTDGKGADVIYDPVGGPYTEPALRSIAWRGRLLVVGFAAGEIPKIPLNLTLLKGCAIVGVFWGEFTKREPESFAAAIRQLHLLTPKNLESHGVAAAGDTISRRKEPGEALAVKDLLAPTSVRAAADSSSRSPGTRRSRSWRRSSTGWRRRTRLARSRSSSGPARGGATS